MEAVIEEVVSDVAAAGSVEAFLDTGVSAQTDGAIAAQTLLHGLI